MKPQLQVWLSFFQHKGHEVIHKVSQSFVLEKGLRNFHSFVILLLLVNTAAAQQDARLPGLVVEQNSKFNTGKVIYLSNAQIKAAGANPQLSDANGRFTLVFADKPVGNVARIYANKSGYELVNEEEMKQAAVLGRNAPLKVVMCREGQLYESQVAYYKIARDAALASYQKRVNILQKEGREKDVLIAEMQVEFNQQIVSVAEANKLLEQQLQATEKQAKELADKWVTVNLDDQSPTYQRAFRAFLAEDLDLALRILDSVDLEQRLAMNTAEKQREETLIEQLEASVARRDTQLQQDVNQCVFKARLHELRYEFLAAEEMYELALKYDISNIELIFEYAHFLQKQNQFEKAIHRYQEALQAYRMLAQKNPAVYLPDVAATMNNLAVLLEANNELFTSRAYYEEALQIQRSLAQKNPEVYLLHVALTLDNLGILLSATNDLVTARAHYQEALQIKRSLAQKNPAVYLPDVALTLNNLGVLLSTTSELDSAHAHYEEALQHYRSLAQKNPAVYLPYVATTLNNLGLLLSSTNDLVTAQAYYEEALQIRRNLVQKNPAVYLPDVAATLNNLGLLLSATNDLVTAQAYYEEALQHYRNLAQKNSAVYLPDVAATLNNFGLLLEATNEMITARAYYEEALQIRRSLAQKNPAVYMLDVATTLNNLGVLLSATNELVTARAHYEEALQIRRSLAQKNPAVYLPDVAATLNNLGVLLRANNELDLAKPHYEEALEYYRSLAQKNPEAYLPHVALTLSNLGLLLSNTNEQVTAQAYYEEALQIRRSLAQKNPSVYNLNVCATSINLALLYEALLKNSGDLSLKTAGLALMEDCRQRLSIFADDHPTVAKYRGYIEYLNNFFVNFE